MDSRARPGPTAAIAFVAVLFAARYHAFLAGGVLYFRDAGFFFVPWRSLFTRLAAQGFPFWNDWVSSGRAYAADPNAAVFWPLTSLLFVMSPTFLSLTNTFVAVLLFFVALRLLRLSARSAAAGCAVLLFSGVFQAMPVFFGLAAAASVLPLAAVSFSHLDSVGGRGLRRDLVLASGALGLSLLGGEPAVTGIGGAACLAIVLARIARDLRLREAPAAIRRAGAAVLAFLLAGGVAAVQLLPAGAELARSSRGQEMTAEHGSLFWSVRPARVLTLLEPRLTGDPLAEDAADYWGAGTFDAGNAYFYDLALGLVPLALAAVAAADRRGRAALGLALGAIVLSFGRYFPLSDFLGRRLTIFRYPEKWWMLASFSLAVAAAVGVERLTEADDGERNNAWRRLKICSLALAMPLLFAGLVASVSPEFLRRGIWGLGLGTGDAPAAHVAQALCFSFIAGFSSLVVIALVSFLVLRGRVQPILALSLLGLMFLADGARRVAGSCPAGAPDLYVRETPAVSLVRGEMGRGRFYDDGADVPEVAARRTREAGGLDPLRPVTGVVFGIRYAGENDIDRMTPSASARWVAETARLPWAAEKLARLRMAGVTVVRTHVPLPDPAGAVEVGRAGADRILRIQGARPAFALIPKEAGAGGTLEVVVDRPNETRLSLMVPAGGGVLAMTRTFDPSWKGTLDGSAALPVYSAGGFLSAAGVPAGIHTVVLRYRNPLFLWGAAVSAVSLLAILALGLPARAGRKEGT